MGYLSLMFWGVRNQATGDSGQVCGESATGFEPILEIGPLFLPPHHAGLVSSATMSLVIEEDSYWDRRRQTPEPLRDVTATAPNGRTYDLEARPVGVPRPFGNNLPFWALGWLVHALRYPRQWEIDIRQRKPFMLMPDVWIYEGYQSKEEANAAIPDVLQRIESGVCVPDEILGGREHRGAQVTPTDEPSPWWSIRVDNSGAGLTWIRRNGWLLAFLTGSCVVAIGGGITGLTDPKRNPYLAGAEFAIGMVLLVVTVRVILRGLRR